MKAYSSDTVVDSVVRLIFPEAYSINDPLLSGESFRAYAKKMVNPACELLSSLFLYEASGYPTIRSSPLSGWKIIVTGFALTCLTSLLIALQSLIVGAADADAHLENAKQIWN